MADTVHAVMEGMVPELEDYARRGYFSRAEIDNIVHRRQQFEYKLRRRNAVKSDFLKYYEHEWKLEQLRRLRQKARKISGARSLADYGILRRIHFIFDRATRKFKGDMGLWVAWLQFCKTSNSRRQVSKVVTKALKLHPGVPFLWAYAAAWEFEGNSNPAAARQLLQTGLRSCPRDASLWIELFRMELLYAHKLLARRQALGLNGQEQFSSEGANTEASTRNTVASPPAEETASTAADGAILEGKLAELVVSEARRKLPKDAKLQQRMLELAAEIPCLGTRALQQQISDSLVADFGQDEHGCTVVADCIWKGSLCPSRKSEEMSGPSAACAFLVHQVRSAPTPPLQGAALDFLEARLADIDNAAAGSKIQNGAGRVGAASLNDVLIAIEHIASMLGDNGMPLSARAVACRTNVLCRWGRHEEGVQQLDASLQAGYAEQGILWDLRLQLLNADLIALRNLSSEPPSGQGSGVLVQAALTRVDRAWRWRLLPQALECLLACDQPPDLVLDALKGLLRTPVVANVPTASIAAAVLIAIRSHFGRQRAEELATELAALPSPGPEYWHARLRMLTSDFDERARPLQGSESDSPFACPSSTSKQAKKGDEDRREGLRRCETVFEHAVQAHGEDDVQLWVLWASFRRRHGTDSGSILQRGVAALRSALADELTELMQKI